MLLIMINIKIVYQSLNLNDHILKFIKQGIILVYINTIKKPLVHRPVVSLNQIFSVFLSSFYKHHRTYYEQALHRHGVLLLKAYVQQPDLLKR